MGKSTEMERLRQYIHDGSGMTEEQAAGAVFDLVQQRDDLMSALCAVAPRHTGDGWCWCPSHGDKHVAACLAARTTLARVKGGGK